MRHGKLKIRFSIGRGKRRAALRTLAVAGPLTIAAVAAIAWMAGSSPDDPVMPPIPPEIAKMDLDGLRKQVGLLEGRIQKLEDKEERLFPAGPVVLVDTAANQIFLVQGSRVLVKDKCSTGSGLELTETNGKRTWTFETPRGGFRALSKVTNPVWYRPDWAFVEEGEPIPKDRASRAVADVLGDYAIAFGDGYFIHGTLYTRMLGSSVTHGCVRVDDESLKKIYQAAQPGTPIWIF